MAVPASIEFLAGKIAVPVAQAERVLRSGRSANQLPQGSRRGHVEWTPRDYGAFLVGLAAPISIEAADTIVALGGTEFVTSPGAAEGDRQPRLGPGTLLDVLARVIERAGHSLDAAAQSPKHPGVPIPHFIHFKPNGVVKAELVWLGPAGIPECIEVYAPPGEYITQAGAFTHIVVMDTTALIHAGEAWRDSLASQGRRLPPPSKNESAPTAGTARAPIRGRIESNDPGQSDTPGYALSRPVAQGVRSGHSPPTPGSYTHGRTRNRPCPPRP
jgi:hypothetical protein